MLKIRRSRDRRIFNMEIPLSEKMVCIETGPKLEDIPTWLGEYYTSLWLHQIIGNPDDFHYILIKTIVFLRGESHILHDAKCKYLFTFSSK